MIWFVDKSLHFVFKWHSGAEVASQQEAPEFDNHLTGSLCACSPRVCVVRLATLQVYPPSHPVVAGGGSSLSQTTSFQFITLGCFVLLCFLFVFLAQKSSNNWLPFMQLHWFHFSLWLTCKSAEQEDGEFVSSSTVNQSTLIPNLILCHELSRVWPTLHRTAAASLAFISSCVCTHAFCCTFNYSISQHRALPMLLAFIMRTGTDKL